MIDGQKLAVLARTAQHNCHIYRENGSGSSYIGSKLCIDSYTCLDIAMQRAHVANQNCKI